MSENKNPRKCNAYGGDEAELEGFEPSNAGYGLRGLDGIEGD